MDKIFVIQVRKTGDRKAYENYREFRNIGWFETFAEAEECLLANPAIFSDDGFYKVALIEEAPKGPYGACNVEDMDSAIKWYRLVGDTNCKTFNAKYVEAPDLRLPGVIGYTIG